MTILLFAEKLLSVIVGAEQFIKMKTGKRRPEKTTTTTMVLSEWMQDQA